MNNSAYPIRTFKQILSKRIYVLKLLISDKYLRKSTIKNVRNLLKKYFYYRLIKKKQIIIISLTEHIGDIIACEPVSYYLRTKNPNSRIIWVVNQKYRELVADNPNLDSVATVTSLGEWILLKALIKKRIKIFDLHLNEKPCAKYGLILNNCNPQNISIYNYYFFGNILKSFSLTSNLSVPDIGPRLHLKDPATFDFLLPANYITIHATSNEESRCWDNEKWNILIHHLLITYSDLYIIEIGFKNVINNSSKFYLNYCNKFSLKENAFIIKNSFFFIGIDSGFAHFANAYKVNSLILIGYYRSFKNYMPYSGYFYRTKEETILYHDDILKELTVTTIFEKLKSRIDYLLNPEKNDNESKLF